MNKNTFTFWKNIFAGLIVVLNLSFFAISLAQTPPPIIPDGTNQTVMLPHNTDPTTQGDYLYNGLLPGIAATIIALTGGLSLLFMVVAGLFLVTSYGNPERAAAAKKTITYAIIGIIISGLSYAIVAIIASINVTPS